MIEYWLYLRDAEIYRNSQTREGLDYLEKCWMLAQTAPDRQALRKKFAKQTDGGN